MALIDEINSRSKEIYADHYSISIGEIMSMYNEGDLEIHPEFQRFFRWTDSQKTKLIESFLLNIPVPPIFVSQREDGVWDVVDGLQRLSTLIQFIGIYKDEQGNRVAPLVLQGTKLLPSLAGKRYAGEEGDNVFTDAERRYLKRAKLDLIILKKESDASSKYELFQRLNTGGTSLSDQEVRNCLMVMCDPKKYEDLENLSKDSNFNETLRISDRALSERFDLELVTRFICLRTERLERLRGVQDFGNYLDERILEIFKDPEVDWDKELKIFTETFEKIYSQLSDQAFCKFDQATEKFKGRFYTSAFEIIAIGLGRHPEFDVNNSFLDKVKRLWIDIDAESIRWQGYNASSRIEKTINLGDRLYGEN